MKPLAWPLIAALALMPIAAAAHDLPRPHTHPAAMTQLASGSQQHAAISVTAAFARASAGPAKTGAAYLTIHNAGSGADRLVAAKADVAKRVELHTHRHEGGVMKMRPIAAVDIPAGGKASLKPGGDHVMFMGLTAPLTEGESFTLTLVFERAGEITVTVEIGSVGAMGASHSRGVHGTHRKTN
ncbi:MAG: copper chaperone PCu(A)C [Alphaproteobacteria bacterium]|nr:copper chaperone PCu(A)C [Alphaproteobacteria bacterium]